MHGIYPNPSNGPQFIYFTLKNDADVELTIYNVAGEVIYVTEFRGVKGKNITGWQAENKHRIPVASGIYVVRLEATGINDSTGVVWDRAAIVK